MYKRLGLDIAKPKNGCLASALKGKETQRTDSIDPKGVSIWLGRFIGLDISAFWMSERPTQSSDLWVDVRRSVRSHRFICLTGFVVISLWQGGRVAEWHTTAALGWFNNSTGISRSSELTLRWCPDTFRANIQKEIAYYTGKSSSPKIKELIGVNVKGMDFLHRLQTDIW